ncbi:MAG: threonylcarbamoyl-AMP synthase [Gammaproteobacteria bacterium 13_2_20CM_66_19]|nr:MAG: threonylcarbamoyl-AMP synthase [Gammaproteobacteria bacterium 13_2_20CM_66_19]TLY89696.1 MAG: threonylcarbamoyl-AMP synthase [Gammaproteobacteria bacterium]TLZ12438.1 MAG: threonylcarbamoyl-AMP synthase [Gammaproteobacteria bacterium]
MVRIVRATQVEIESAVQALRDGELVAFATETVYGLGANAQNPAAVAKIFAAKGRPPNHPVIVHLDSPRFLHRWVREVPEVAMRLAERFWPGPFTMVMPRAANVHDVITGGQDTIAIRVPAHPMAQQLLTAFGGGIAAPSANRYGRLSPTRAEHVREELGDAVRVILDGGECQIGLESTIVSFEGDGVRLLRPGSVTATQISAVVGELFSDDGRPVPRVPGSPPTHYAPTTHMTIVPAGEIDAQADAASSGGRRVAVLAQRLPLRAHKYATWINAGRRPENYGRDLYANLRTLDKAGCRRILVQAVPDGERWDAIRDRLVHAATSVAESDDGSGAMAVLP